MPIHHVDVTEVALPLAGFSAAPGGALWVEIRPDLRRSAVVAGDILAALGKRRDVAGIGRREHDDIELAIAWMHAYEITALILTEAQRLHPLVLRQVIAWAKEADIPLWLLHRPPRTDAFVRRLERLAAHPRPLDEVPQPITRSTRTGERQRPSLRVTLPAAGFHQFRTACSTTLGPKAAERVALRHASTAVRCYDVMQRDGATPDVIAGLVEGVLRTAPEDDLLVTDIRALQLAAWHHDIYLKTDIPMLLASPERQLTDLETVDQALVAYRQPHRSVAVTLSLHQVGVRALCALTISMADRRGRFVICPDGRLIDMPEHGGRALRALVELRHKHGASEMAPLLHVSERAISQALNDANTDLNIRVHGRRAERHAHPGRWLRRLGLTFHPLT